MSEQPSTVPKSPTPTTGSSSAAPDDESKKGLGLSLTQTLGGALAAMTAAVVGSQLGVAGTVIGAALASIVAAVGGTLYTASLRHTRDKVRTVLVNRSGEPVTKAAGEDASAPPTGSSAVPGVAAAVAPRPAPRQQQRYLRLRRLLPRILLAAGAAFVLAAVAVTGIEAIMGHALSGGSGTTISQVQRADAKPTKEPSKAPADSPSAQPSQAESSQPGAAETPSNSPTAPASPTSTPEPPPSTSSRPSAPASASAGQ